MSSYLDELIDVVRVALIHEIEGTYSRMNVLSMEECFRKAMDMLRVESPGTCAKNDNEERREHADAVISFVLDRAVPTIEKRVVTNRCLTVISANLLNGRSDESPLFLQTRDLGQARCRRLLVSVNLPNCMAAWYSGMYPIANLLHLRGTCWIRPWQSAWIRFAQPSMATPVTIVADY